MTVKWLRFWAWGDPASRQRAGRGIGGAGVLVVMRARQSRHGAQVDGRDLAAFAPFAQEAFAREDEPSRALQFLGRRDADHPVIGGAFGELVGEILPFCLVDADHGTVGATFGEEAAFGGKIAAHSGVAIEVIRREIGEDGHVGGEGACQIGLVGGEFQHDNAAIAGGAMSSTPRPILPASWLSRPASVRMWWIKAEVVDLPFEPVTVITLGGVS